MHHKHQTATHEHSENQYNLQYKHYQEQYTNNKIVFHDPWEDYYRKQETKEMPSNNNNDESNNGQGEEEDKQNQEHLRYHEEEQNRDFQQEQENQIDFPPEKPIDFYQEPEKHVEYKSNEADLDLAHHRDDKQNDNDNKSLDQISIQTQESSVCNTEYDTSSRSFSIDSFSHDSTSGFVETDNTLSDTKDEQEETKEEVTNLSFLYISDVKHMYRYIIIKMMSSLLFYIERY